MPLALIPSCRACYVVSIRTSRSIFFRGYSSGSATEQGSEQRRRPVQKYDRLRQFVDWTYTKIKAGDGGNGSNHIRKTRQINRGGPDGGDGGRGGHVILITDENLKQLKHIKPHYQAEHGGKGLSNDKDGKNGNNLIIKVPVGTVLKDRYSRELLCSLDEKDQHFTIATGGKGGLGNLHFRSSVNQLPTETTPGEVGESKSIELELKIIADVGLVGFPNAGKSTLLRALSRASPAVAAYPFTTLRPHIGAVEYGDLSQIFVADIPGLVEGAHLNRGLGHSFLRHIERCKCLLYVMDLSVDSPINQLNCLKKELNLYQDGLADLPSVIIGNKIDIVASKESAVKELEEQSNMPVIPASGKHKLNIDEVKAMLRTLCLLKTGDCTHKARFKTS